MDISPRSFNVLCIHISVLDFLKTCLDNPACLINIIIVYVLKEERKHVLGSLTVLFIVDVFVIVDVVDSDNLWGAGSPRFGRVALGRWAGFSGNHLNVVFLLLAL